MGGIKVKNVSNKFTFCSEQISITNFCSIKTIELKFFSVLNLGWMPRLFERAALLKDLEYFLRLMMELYRLAAGNRYFNIPKSIEFCDGIFDYPDRVFTAILSREREYVYWPDIADWKRIKRSKESTL
jgi:hypothetical protein